MFYSGGWSSRLYLVEAISSNTDLSKSISQVTKFLIRLYGGKYHGPDEAESFVTLDKATQVLIYFKCGELGLGPKIYGVFNGGRLEEYIPSHTLTNSEVQDPEIQTQLMRKLVRFHHLQVPVTNRRIDMIEKPAERFLIYESERGRSYLCKVCAHHGQSVEDYAFDWRPELEWFRKIVPKVQSPDVLCTNDMNHMNCLIRDEPDQFGEIVTLVDYELASMNPRGRDLGNHFIMWEYKADESESLVYPSEDVRKRIIAKYLAATLEITGRKPIEDIDTVEHLLLESEFYALMWLVQLYSEVLQPKDPPHMMADPKNTLVLLVSMLMYFKIQPTI